MLRPRRARVRAPLALAVALALAPGCRATGETANGYFDWGGRVFTTNPGSVAPYFVGFGLFYIAALPIDLFTWIATAIAWPSGSGEDYQGSALAPSIFLGTTGGVILGAPFFPLGLPWWSPEEAETSPKPAATADAKTPPAATSSTPASEKPTAEKPASTTPAELSPSDTSPTAGAPGR
jgi:hypothetical protein